MIKAIETEYKGYRFRSRLEARWAVFFEERGEEWQYEVEGFELPAGRYLPDFYLPKWNMFVEVKPPPTPISETPTVYMAGRMSHPCFRPPQSALPDDYSHSADLNLLRTVLLDNLEFNYSGPFRLGESDHIRVHGSYTGGCGDEEPRIFRRSLNGINKCDVFFVLFEDLEAFGSLVEIGYAHALGKFIVAGFVGIAPDSVKDHDNDLWFAAHCASKTLCFPTRDKVIQEFQFWLTQSFALPEEQQLAKELAIQKDCHVAVVYGDPVEAFENECAGVKHFNRGKVEYPTFMTWSFKERDRAALLARQARFEFGQSGAPTHSK